jgi:ketosteroid isomerase-like protein
MATTDALVAAEKTFASVATREGMRAAFLQFLADDSILFRPEPVDGLAWFEKQPAPPGLLSWRPEFAEMAASGDLGYTTGPWTFRSSSDTDPVQFGQYVSIWRRGQRSLWKVVIDVGITNPPPVDDSIATQVVSIEHEFLRENVTETELVQVEVDLAERVQQNGYLEAMEQMAAANVWVLRTGQTPFRGFVDLAEAAPAQPMSIEWKISGSAIAPSGDLGYVYGTSRQENGDQVEERYSYLRIWRWGVQDHWELALDIDNPIPAGT